MKKIVASLMAICVISGMMSSIPVSAANFLVARYSEPNAVNIQDDTYVFISSMATEGVFEGLHYMKDEQYVIITGVDEGVTEIRVPAEIDGLEVIGCEGIFDREDVTLISLPETLLYCNAEELMCYYYLSAPSIDERFPWIREEEFDGDFLCIDHILVGYRGDYSEKIITIPEGVTCIASTGLTGSVDIYEEVEAEDGTIDYVYKESEKIEEFAWCHGCAFRSVQLPKSLRALNQRLAFAYDEGAGNVEIGDAYYPGTAQEFRDNVTIVAAEDGRWDPRFPLIHCIDETLTINSKYDEETGTTYYSLETYIPPVTGDITGDMIVNAEDAAEVLIAAAQMGAGEEIDMPYEQYILADVNQDGDVNAVDATEILQYAAAVGAGEESRSPYEYFEKLH